MGVFLEMNGLCLCVLSVSLLHLSVAIFFLISYNLSTGGDAPSIYRKEKIMEFYDFNKLNSIINRVDYSNILRNAIPDYTNILSSINKINMYNDALATIHDPINNFNNMINDSLLNKNNIQEIINNLSCIRSFEALFNNKNIDLYNIFNNATVSDDHVELPEEDLETISDIFEPCDMKVSKDPSTGVCKISFRDFVIIILIPIIMMLPPMIQSEYYQRVNLLEAQKDNISQAEFENKICDLLEEQNIAIDQINDALKVIISNTEESSQENLTTGQEPPSNPPELPLIGKQSVIPQHFEDASLSASDKSDSPE